MMSGNPVSIPQASDAGTVADEEAKQDKKRKPCHSPGDADEDEEHDQNIEKLIRRGKLRPRIEARKVNNQDFKKLMVIGTGAYAKVYLVRDNLDNNYYAMKVLKKKHVIQKNQAEHTMTERNILGHSRAHPFIVGLMFAFQTKYTLNLVLEYCTGGELYYHLSRLGKFPLERARFYTAELTLALGHLHSENIVYRDLKPENVLIDKTGHLKLADFGLSKRGIVSFNQGGKTFCGTPEYLAPEVLNRSGYGNAVDWWSLGALLFEMLTGLPPWYSQNRKKMFSGICNGKLIFPDSVDPVSRDLIAKLLVRNPMNRLGSKQGVASVKAESFFSTVDWDKLLQLQVEPPWKPEEGFCFVDNAYTRLPLNSHDESTVKQAAHDPPRVPVPTKTNSSKKLNNTNQTIGPDFVGSSAPSNVPVLSVSPSSLSRQFSLECGVFDGFSYTAPSHALSRSPMLARSPVTGLYHKKRINDPSSLGSELIDNTIQKSPDQEHRKSSLSNISSVDENNADDFMETTFSIELDEEEEEVMMMMTG